MLTSERGLNLIKFYEGFSPVAYICAAGYPTIGFGHMIRKGERFGTLSEAEAEELLKRDVQSAEHSVVSLTRSGLTQNKFDALVSFVFNLGTARYQQSTLRQMVNIGHDDMVPKQFLRWVYANGTVLRGLVRRRQAEADLYSEDDEDGV